MNTWKLTYEGFEPEQEKLREALLTLGNGYFGTRGAIAECAANKSHYPGTYMAGLFNAIPTDIANRAVINEDYVNCPNWLTLQYKINDGDWFDPAKAKILSWKVELDMKRGVLLHRYRWQDEEKRVTRVEHQRIVSMDDPHVCATRTTLTPENYNAKISVRSAIDGLIVNGGVERYKQLRSRHLIPLNLAQFSGDGVYLEVMTTQSKVRIAMAQRTHLYRGAERVSTKLRVEKDGHDRIVQKFVIDAKKRQKYTIEKLVSLFSSRDPGVLNPVEWACKNVAKLDRFDGLLRQHEAAWRALWDQFDVELVGDEFIQLTLRLHTFHILQCASMHNDDIDAGLPARGLHGEAYRGHVFWDEMYAFPFYTMRQPLITRSLLRYRYRRLDAARDYAKQHGYRGAMFPWQSASTGEETTQVVHLNPLSGKWGPDNSCLQRHVSIAIAYNIWSYYHATGDKDFMNRYGLEMLIEIAQFWSSIAKLNTKSRKYEIHGVMGPDEFHEKYPGAKKGGLRNNAYTNVMAVWVIEKALYLLDTLSKGTREALLTRTKITDADLKRMRDITRKMLVPMDKNGIIHQHEGYMKLKELDWEGYRAKYKDIHRADRILKAEGLSPDDFKVSKQADTLMLFYLLAFDEIRELFGRLGHKFDTATMQKNFDYYIQRTSHGSTLSHVVHAAVCHFLGQEKEANGMFYNTMKSDIYDTQGGTTPEGIHVGVMAGSIHIFMKCYAGLRFAGDRLLFRPKLPKQWKRTSFRVRFRNIWFDATITHQNIKVLARPLQGTSISPPSDILVEVNGRVHKLAPGKARTIAVK